MKSLSQLSIKGNLDPANGEINNINMYSQGGVSGFELKIEEWSVAKI